MGSLSLRLRAFSAFAFLALVLTACGGKSRGDILPPVGGIQTKDIDASGGTFQYLGQPLAGTLVTIPAGVISGTVTFTLGLEFLQGLSSTSTRRFNGDAKLQSKLGAGFSLATSFSLRYDGEPLPGKENVDTITALNLVFKVL